MRSRFSYGRSFRTHGISCSIIVPWRHNTGLPSTQCLFLHVLQLFSFSNESSLVYKLSFCIFFVSCPGLIWSGWSWALDTCSLLGSELDFGKRNSFLPSQFHYCTSIFLISSRKMLPISIKKLLSAMWSSGLSAFPRNHLCLWTGRLQRKHSRISVLK